MLSDHGVLARVAGEAFGMTVPGAPGRADGDVLAMQGVSRSRGHGTGDSFHIDGEPHVHRL